MSDPATGFQFYLPLPWHFVSMDGQIVSIPVAGGRGLVVLSDSDLGERFAAVVRANHEGEVKTIEIRTAEAALHGVQVAQKLWAVCLAVDPEVTNREPLHFKYRGIDI